MEAKRILRKYVGCFILAAAALLPMGSAEAGLNGLFLYTGALADGSFNHSGYVGMRRAVQESGGSTSFSAVQVPVDHDAQWLEEQCEGKGFVVAMGQVFSYDMEAMAKRHPEKSFILVDGNADEVVPNGNLLCLNYRDGQIGYMAGIVAAINSKTGKIGFIGANKYNEGVQRFWRGYKKGAQSIGGVSVVQSYIGHDVRGFNNPKAMRLLAAKMYDGGCDVIFHSAGASGKGLFPIAAKKGKWAIGCDADQAKFVTPLQRSHILTSVLRPVDKAIAENIQRLDRGTFKGGYVTVDLIHNGIEYYVLNDTNRGRLAGSVPALSNAKARMLEGSLVVK